MNQEALQELGLAPETAQEGAEAFGRELEQARGVWEAALTRERREHAVFLALAQAGAKNLKAAGALIDLPGDAVPGEDGTLPGLAEQIASLKGREDAAFLFEGSEAPQISGFRPAEGLSPGEGGAGQALTLAQAIEQSMQTDDDE